MWASTAAMHASSAPAGSDASAWPSPSRRRLRSRTRSVWRAVRGSQRTAPQVCRSWERSASLGIASLSLSTATATATATLTYSSYSLGDKLTEVARGPLRVTPDALLASAIRVCDLCCCFFFFSFWGISLVLLKYVLLLYLGPFAIFMRARIDRSCLMSINAPASRRPTSAGHARPRHVENEERKA